jgi:starch synthase (maltosyl-transferring)
VSPPAAASPPPRVQIEDPQPLLDCGRHAVKACVGDRVEVSATIFANGHDLLRAVVRSRGPGEREWREAPMHRSDAELGGDRWSGAFTVDAQGRWEWTVDAWIDAEASWRNELERKIAAGQRDLSAELLEGAALLARAATRARDGDRADRGGGRDGARRSPDPGGGAPRARARARARARLRAPPGPLALDVDGAGG